MLVYYENSRKPIIFKNLNFSLIIAKLVCTRSLLCLEISGWNFTCANVEYFYVRQPQAPHNSRLFWFYFRLFANMQKSTHTQILPSGAKTHMAFPSFKCHHTHKHTHTHMQSEECCEYYFIIIIIYFCGSLLDIFAWIRTIWEIL